MADLSRDAIESGLRLIERLVREIPEPCAELEGSRRLFTAAPGAPQSDVLLAQRRHVEWFCLERASDALEGVPAEALREAWHEHASDLERDAYASLLESRASAFEISEVDERKGLWMRDLFGLGEYPVLEPEAVSELSAGDLLVGRIFPAQDGAFRLSPAMACFRDPALRDALKADAKRLRAGRRGLMRIEQVELERLFFGGGENAPVASTVEEEQNLLAALEQAGLESAEIDRIVGDFKLALNAGSEGGTVVTETLNRLAFDTNVDLDPLQRSLVDLWALLVRRRADEPRRDDTADPELTREAIEAFERASQEGGDLEQRFQHLETQLGFGPLAADEDGGDGPVPDFPGVVGAMVEEFLWDRQREHGPDQGGLFRLRELSKYAEPIGVFENLGARDLVDFVARWLLDQGPSWTPSETVELFDGLELFCRWTEEHHSHPLWSEFEEHFTGLRQSVPRLREARPWLNAGRTNTATSYDVLSTGDSWAELRDPQGEDATVNLDPRLCARLRSGDLVLGEHHPEGLRVYAVYPEEIRSFLGEATPNDPQGRLS